MSIRRLPVYILADCSGSMTGDPIESVKAGIHALHSDLMNCPSSIETVFLSVITFDSNARQLAPLTELQAFNPPVLVASGTTALGAALKLLIDCLGSEVIQNSAEGKGDWKPLVFLLTDGIPTDNWQQFADELKSKHLGKFVALACGQGADTSLLKSITEDVCEMKNMGPDGFKEFFKWVSNTIKTVTVSRGAATAEGVKLSEPPPGVVFIPG